VRGDDVILHPQQNKVEKWIYYQMRIDSICFDLLIQPFFLFGLALSSE
jgi:hypothetical protein